MKLTGTLIRMEEKRTLRILPQYFLGVFLLTALIGVVVVFSVLATDKDVTKQDMTVALVLHDNDFLRTFGLDVLERGGPLHVHRDGRGGRRERS